MVRLEWLLLMQLVMGMLMLVFLQKIKEMKKQIDTITKEVMNYISYVTEDEKEKDLEEEKVEKWREVGQEEAQNRLIQAVLGDYFP